MMGSFGTRCSRRSSSSRSRCLSSCFFVFLLFVVEVVEAQLPYANNKKCIMLYQMADNDLERFLMADNKELLSSQLIRNRDISTWVYFDARNGGYAHGLPNLFPRTTATQPVPHLNTKFDGSRYLHYDHDAAKMIIDTEIPGETNSDASLTIFNFVKKAVTDCIQNDQTSQFMLFFASHGGGFNGFGGDENIRKRRRATATTTTTTTTTTTIVEQQFVNQTTNNDNHNSKQNSERRNLSAMIGNQEIVNAIRGALSFVPDGPEKIDVLGFDACLMMAIGSLDEYRDVAHYVLGSETTEPGHGWAYTELTGAGTVVDIAKDIITKFVESPQNPYNSQYAPKQLSLTDTNKFTTFLNHFEILMAEFTRLLQNAQNDLPFYTYLNRARTTCLSYENQDDAGTLAPSSISVLSFLTTFQNYCQPPTATSNLGKYLQNAIDAYRQMILSNKVGSTTQPLTGMGLMWPVKAEYFAYQGFWWNRLFNPQYHQSYQDEPNYRNFLNTFYNTNINTNDYTITQQNVYGSVCTSVSNRRDRALEQQQQIHEGQLLFQPKVQSALVNKAFVGIETEVSSDVDYVFIEYALNIRPLISSRRFLFGSKSDPESTAESESESSSATKTNTGIRNKQQQGRRTLLEHIVHKSNQQDKQQHHRNDYKMFSKKGFNAPNPHYDHMRRSMHETFHRSRNNNNNRKLQSDDPFLLYGGDLKGTYVNGTEDGGKNNNNNGNEAFGVWKYKTKWDGKFYGIVEDETKQFTPVYAVDKGYGVHSKSVPLLYFNRSVINERYGKASKKEFRETLDLPLTSIEEGFDHGGIFGYFTFTLNNVTKQYNKNSMSLYAFDPVSQSISEKPPISLEDGGGGYIVPIVFVDGFIGDEFVHQLVGGFQGSVFEWTGASDTSGTDDDTTVVLPPPLSIGDVTPESLLTNLGLNDYRIDIIGIDFDITTLPQVISQPLFDDDVFESTPLSSTTYSDSVVMNTAPQQEEESADEYQNKISKIMKEKSGMDRATFTLTADGTITLDQFAPVPNIVGLEEWLFGDGIGDGNGDDTSGGSANTSENRRLIVAGVLFVVAMLAFFVL